MIYETAGIKDFSSILAESGTIYHLRGDYLFKDGDIEYLPVNRSYSPVYTADKLQTNPDAPYAKDRVLHDDITLDTKTIGHEHLMTILGKQFLFLTVCHNNYNVLFDPLLSENSHISAEAKRVGDVLSKSLLRKKVNASIGVLGSHQTGMNGPESDLDLVIWTPRYERGDTIRAIRETFTDLGYTNPNETNRLGEFATRIANLGKLTIKTGEYLASQRLRWISPQGVHTSVQCFHSDYDHNATKKTLDAILMGSFEYLGQVEDQIISIADTSDPYNFPRRWDIDASGSPATALGFDWVHQGMGVRSTLSKSKEGLFKIRAARLRDENAKDIFALVNPGDYIVPIEI